MNKISVLAKSQQMFYYFFHLNEQQQTKWTGNLPWNRILLIGLKCNSSNEYHGGLPQGRLVVWN